MWGVECWTNSSLVRSSFSLYFVPVHCRKLKLSQATFNTTKLEDLAGREKFYSPLSNTLHAHGSPSRDPQSEMDPVQADGDRVCKNCPMAKEMCPQRLFKQEQWGDQQASERKVQCLYRIENNVTSQSKRDCFKYLKSKAWRKLWKVQNSLWHINAGEVQ